MNALDTLFEIINNDNLVNSNLKFCLVNENKLPFKINNMIVNPNKVEDFVDIKELNDLEIIKNYSGIGISIQASNITAIDVDKCFSKPFNLDSADERALDIISRFLEYAYIEFSFSGKGLRILFRQNLIENYSLKYYIKNDNYNIEYYQPNQSYRYVTLTGKTIINNPINFNKDFTHIIINFLDDYMKRPEKIKKNINTTKEDSKTIEQLLKKVKSRLLVDFIFQEKWFSQAPGSNSNESEIDFYLLSYLYENITQNKEKLRLIFESSPYFKSKDSKHLKKWTYNDYRYYNYVYERLG